MDPHFHNITIALYRRPSASGPVFTVHSYSGVPGVEERLAFVVRAMHALAGMQPVDGEDRTLRFRCENDHTLAARRAFLEACKLNPAVALEARALSIYDKKSEQQITVMSRGSGVYAVQSDGGDPSRASAVAGGLAKLADLAKTEEGNSGVRFTCGQSHDELVGLLLPRALNVRAVLREQELSTSRGVLVAPSAQQN